MNTKNPMRGLLSYMFQAASGNLLLTLLTSLALAAALLLTGIAFFHSFFVMAAIAGAPYIIMASMGGKKSHKWERFQISMPIRRSDLVNALYLCIFAASLVGIPLVVIVTSLYYVLHESIFEHTLTTVLIDSSALFFSLPLLMAGLLFPLACTKAGENRGEALFTLCLLPAVANSLFMPMLAERLGFPKYTLALLPLAVALLVFVVSYFITRRIYAKLDF